MNGSTLVVLLSLWLVLTSSSDAKIVDAAGSITFFDLGAGDAFTYQAEIVYSDEGKESLRLPPYDRLVLNVMMPPENYTDLCEYPWQIVTPSIPAEEDEEGMNDNQNRTLSPTAHSNFNDSLLEDGISIPIEFDFSPIAFLVPLQRRRNGRNITDCDLLTKIRVALQYQREIIKDRQLWSIIFYNAHGDERDEGDERNTWGNRNSSTSEPNTHVHSMEMPANLDSTDIPGLDSLLLATISHTTGMKMREKIERAKEDIQKYLMIGDNITFAPYYLLHKGNPDWQFPVSLDRNTDLPFSEDDSHINGENDNPNKNPSENKDEDDYWASFTFFWIRFVLFIFIFCFPLLQCCRMWFAAGGRIELRRNDRGWITGVVHQPARQNWYDVVASVRNDYRNRIATAGRKKLTKEQVLALPEIEYTGRPEGSEVGDDHQNDKQAQVDVESVDSTKVDSEQEGMHTRETERNQTGSNSIDGPSFITNINTVCSICIEEFQHGEMVRLLPRCGHAFHTDCILPWLTERQEYCPFCKTAVLSLQETEERGEVTEGQQLEGGQGAADDSRQRQGESR
jgi:hypothetical protein